LAENPIAACTDSETCGPTITANFSGLLPAETFAMAPCSVGCVLQCTPDAAPPRPDATPEAGRPDVTPEAAPPDVTPEAAPPDVSSTPDATPEATAPEATPDAIPEASPSEDGSSDAPAE
jgi:hypothetical protein